MSENQIKRLLLARGHDALTQPRVRHPFSGDPEADALINDLRHNPHIFVLACVMDRQIKAQRAWRIPYIIGQTLGGHSFEMFEAASLAKIRRAMTHPEPLHRFVKDMSRNFHSAVVRIRTEYDGDASRIWRGRPSSAEVVYRFLQFPGVGPKIATMAANILARRFKVRFADYYSIDISADVHVKRVFGRLGLTSRDASVEEVVYRARALNPEYPGILDYAAYHLGKEVCRPTRPMCQDCYIRRHCPHGKSILEYMSG